MAASGTRSCTMVVEAAAQIVLEKLDVLLSHPVLFECLSMQVPAKDAKAKLAKIQEFISTQYRPSKTTVWWGQLLQDMYYAEECIDKFHLKEARERHRALHMAKWPLTSLISMYKLGRDLSALVKNMEELCDEELCDEKFLKGEAEGKRKKEPASSSSLASVPWRGKKLVRLTGFWDRQAPTTFLCSEAHKVEMRERIKIGEREPWTSISGEQGAGKTFLARWAYNQAKYMGYEWRAWVHVSASMDPREFLFEILKQAENLASDVKDMKIQEIKTKLYRKLAEVNKYFIVLDDVQLSDMELVKELHQNTPLYSQSRIIITTQDNSIASYLSKNKGSIKLEKLADEESQRMLAWKLHKATDGQGLSNEEKDILNMCRGLSLYISLLGGFLSNAREHERAMLVKEVSMMTLLDILQLSCHKLPVYLKPCFIYMALFPIAFPIPTRRLVRLWLAEGLLESYCHDIERERIRKPEDVGETFILELADRNVIDVVSWRADGSPKACQMLTCLHDMIRPIAMSTGFIHIHDAIRNPTCQQPTKVRWLAEHTNIVIDSRGGSSLDLNLGHIRSFLAFYMRRGILTEDISTFLRKMTSKTAYSLLRVLDLEGVFKPSLQGVLHKLVLLRYLGLRSTMLDSLPSAVADLHYLETLDIKHTNITSLPSCPWKTRNLRHLHLNWFSSDLKNILKACGDNVMGWSKLQTLSGLVIGEVKGNWMMGHVNSLTTLKLFWQRSGRDTSSTAGQAVADWISFGLTNLQSLTFGVIQEAKPKEEAKPAKGAHPAEEKTTKKESKPATLPIGLLPKLLLAEQHHDLLELYLLGQLNKPIWIRLLPVSLRVLTLSGSMVKEDMMPELGGLLRNLRTLRLLANSFQGKSMRFIKDGFPSLKILKIWKLPQLVEVIIEQGAMPHLKELEFRHLERLETVRWIDRRAELENICVISQSDAPDFVDQLKAAIGGETNLHVEKDTEWS